MVIFECFTDTHWNGNEKGMERVRNGKKWNGAGTGTVEERYRNERTTVAFELLILNLCIDSSIVFGYGNKFVGTKLKDYLQW